jgi:hypothetical protein
MNLKQFESFKDKNPYVIVNKFSKGSTLDLKVEGHPDELSDL